MLSYFFFRAEDGIRDADVTGVQTCALPISGSRVHLPTLDPASIPRSFRFTDSLPQKSGVPRSGGVTHECCTRRNPACREPRSEERRVGKEERARRGAYKCDRTIEIRTLQRK